MNKIKCEFTKQELEDIWSALECLQYALCNEKNYKMAEDIEKIIKKVRKYLK